MTAIIVASAYVGISVIVISECVCGCQQIFHDEALKESLFVGTMCYSSEDVLFGRL